MILKVLGLFIIVFLLSGICFGISTLINVFLLKNKKLKHLSFYTFQIVGLILFLIYYFTLSKKPNLFSLDKLSDYTIWIIFILTIAATVLIVFKKMPVTNYQKGEFWINITSGALMEIPQRALTQLILIEGLTTFGVTRVLLFSVLLNSLLWVVCIIVQCLFTKEKITSQMTEVIASFVFSVGIGIIFYLSSNLIIVMSAHGLERTIVYFISTKKKAIKNSE